MDSLNSLFQETGHANDIFVVHRPLVKFTGSRHAAEMLGRLFAWDGKGANGDGWIWKSDEEWQEELCLGRHAVRAARAALEKLGIIETKRASAKGKPTTHYRLKKDVFEKLFCAWAQAEREASSLSEIEQCEEPEAEALSESEHSIVRNQTPHCLKSDTSLSEIEQLITGSTSGETTGSTAEGEGANDARPPSRSVSQSGQGVGGSKDSEPTSQPPSPSPTPGSAPPLPAETAHLEIFGRPLDKRRDQRRLHAAAGQITDLVRWREVLLAWKFMEYNPATVKGLMDWYRDGIPRKVLRAMEGARASPKSPRASPTRMPTKDQREEYRALIARLNGEQHEQPRDTGTGT